MRESGDRQKDAWDVEDEKKQELEKLTKGGCVSSGVGEMGRGATKAYLVRKRHYSTFMILCVDLKYQKYNREGSLW